MDELEILRVVVPNILFSLVCGAIVGFERERKKKSAGFKTIMLIVLGSTLFTTLSVILKTMYPTVDPSRIISYIISGIGFLGAGAIFRPTEDRVSGLTTASVIWVSAGIGVAIGLTLYLTAMILSLITITTLSVVSKIEEKMFPRD